MMTGTVFQRHALLPVTFRLPGQPNLTIEFVVDTGFTGALALPPAAITAMALPYLGEQPANMANDAEVELSLHAATILWNGMEQEVRVLATGRRPLLGTALLDNNELLIQFAERGLVTVDSLQGL
jgi:clan AA aspartic protease